MPCCASRLGVFPPAALIIGSLELEGLVSLMEGTPGRGRSRPALTGGPPGVLLALVGADERGVSAESTLAQSLEAFKTRLLLLLRQCP